MLFKLLYQDYIYLSPSSTIFCVIFLRLNIQHHHYHPSLYEILLHLNQSEFIDTRICPRVFDLRFSLNIIRLIRTNLHMSVMFSTFHIHLNYELVWWLDLRCRGARTQVLHGVTPSQHIAYHSYQEYYVVMVSNSYGTLAISSEPGDLQNIARFARQSF